MTEGDFPRADGGIYYGSEATNANIAFVGANYAKRTLAESTYGLQILLSKTNIIGFDNAANEILLSTDSGSSYVAKETGATENLIAYYVNPHAPLNVVLYNTTQQGQVWLSEDGGESWTAVTPQADGDTSFTKYSVTDVGRVYCYQNDGTVGEIWYTDDAGTGWTQVTGLQAHNPTTDAQMDIATPKNDIIVYCGANGTGAVQKDTGYTLDGGSNWVETTTGSEAGVSEIRSAVYIDSSNYCIDIARAGGTNTGGSHKVVWKGTTISTSDTVIWSASTTTKNYLIRFDSSNFIYNRYNEATAAVWFGITVSYNSDGEAFVFNGPLRSLLGTTELYYHGDDVDGVSRLFNFPLTNNSTQTELYEYNTI